MVTPMIKYTFLLHHRELDKLLEALGKSAIVDISVGNWNSDEKDKAIISEIQRVKQVVDKLEIAKSNNAKSENPLIPTGQKFEDAEQMLEIYDKAFSSLEQLSPLKQKYQREIDELRVWGEFSPELVGRLEKEGVYIHYFLVDAKKFDEQWLVQYPLTECGRYNSDVAFVVVSNSADEIVLEHAQNVKPLKHSVNERENDLLKLNEQIDDNNKIILSLAENVETLNHRHTELSEQLSERKVLQTKLSVADGELYIVEGFSPKDKCDDVDKLFFLNSSVIVLKESPKPEDNPPVLLKNNRFARLSEVITRLYALPQYNELDLTPFFAPFFVFFVGICMGDLGYGIVMAVGSVFAYLKFKESSFSAIAALAIWCSVATMIMGAVTGTFFGIALADTQSLGHLPFLGAMDMFTFSLAVGIIQILYATFIKAIFAMKSFGWRYGVPTLAWAFIIIVSLVAFLGGDMGIDFSFSSSSYTTIIAAL
ncbi:MAG: V-type ATPase 116kDa subunit family protein, partial [Rikenellaceae bacterium]